MGLTVGATFGKIHLHLSKTLLPDLLFGTSRWSGFGADKHLFKGVSLTTYLPFLSRLLLWNTRRVRSLLFTISSLSSCLSGCIQVQSSTNAQMRSGRQCVLRPIHMISQGLSFRNEFIPSPYISVSFPAWYWNEIWFLYKSINSDFISVFNPNKIFVLVQILESGIM